MNKLGILFLATAAYMAASELGSYLSLPPNATPVVWPGSGVALALVLRFGPILILPAVLLGSVLSGLLTICQTLSVLALPDLLRCTVAGLAACVQAMLGYLLCKHYVGLSLALTSLRAIFGFVLVVAIMVCLVACTLAVGGLWLMGMVASGDLMVTWLTWVISDA